MRTTRSLLLIAGLLLFARAAAAQADLRVENNSIELAVLEYAKAHHEVVPTTIVVDSRIRTPDGFCSRSTGVEISSIGRSNRGHRRRFRM